MDVRLAAERGIEVTGVPEGPGSKAARSIVLVIVLVACIIALGVMGWTVLFRENTFSLEEWFFVILTGATFVTVIDRELDIDVLSVMPSLLDWLRGRGGK